nr:hypothetical protein [Pseudarthrobacter sp. NS4]
MDGGELTITDPGESEDFGRDWQNPKALVDFGEREPTEPWTWAGPERSVSGRTWGGCLEVIDELALADRLPPVEDLHGSILLLETSELTPPADWVKRWLRSLGERGILNAVHGVLVARPPTSTFDHRPDTAERTRLRAAQRDAVIEEVTRYNPEAVICIAVPFGHTRPQWILPYGGHITMNGSIRTISASYS